MARKIKVPSYTVENGPRRGKQHTGAITVSRQAQLEAAMEHWRVGHSGYQPEIRPDPANPCRAIWSRFDSCD